MKDEQYGYSITMAGKGFDEALGLVTAALAQEGFGVITQIDVQDTMRKKLGVDFRPYRILGACNPPLAHEAIGADPLIGLLLPCNVVVQQVGDAVEVAIVKPVEMFSVVRRPGLERLASTVDEKVRRILSGLEAQDGARAQATGR